MTATTSKLGADMTDAETAFEAFAGKYDHESNEWLDMDAQQTFVAGFEACRALLARQPAAIDKEAVRCRVCNGHGYRTAMSATGEGAFNETCVYCGGTGKATPLANEASKPAPSVEQDAHAHPFAALCHLLPSDVSWGDALTPDLARHIARAASTSANVAQGAAAVATVKVYETYTGQNGWIEVTQEEYDRTKDKYEHRIRRVSAPPAQTALTGRVLTYRNQPDNVGAWQLGEACRRAAELPAGDYIDRGLGLLKELQAKGYGVIALTAAQSASGDKS